jgi:hypothetical protein
VCLATLLISHAWGAQLPTPAQLRAAVEPFLTVPLPTVESVVGIRMPAPSPMLVVASFGDRGSPVDDDRGYAVGRAQRPQQGEPLEVTGLRSIFPSSVSAAPTS